jgi:ABC-type glycerol-3-phosphate transport system substrate-binding protein
MGKKGWIAAALAVCCAGMILWLRPERTGVEAAQRDHLTIMKPLYSGHIYYPDSELERLLEEKAGVEVTYETPPSFEYRNRLMVRIAGGDIPDIINTYSPNEAEHNALISQGVFLPLDDLLPRFPRLVQAFSPQTWEYMRNPADGKIYGVPWMRDRGGQGMLIRRDWLDRLGLAPPSTLEELTEVLIAFRDRDPDGNGRKDTIPLTFKDHQVWSLQPFFTLFGLNPNWHPSEEAADRLVYGWVEPEAVQVLELLRSFREQGLLDPDFLVGKMLGNDKFQLGNVGVLVFNIGDYHYFAGQPELQAEILDPISHKGHYWSLVLPSVPITRTNQISADSPHPEAALRYLEYQITEGFDLIQYGVEGKTYMVEDGVKVPLPSGKRDARYNTNLGLELLQPEWLYSAPEKYTKFMNRQETDYLMEKLNRYEQHIMYDYLRGNVLLPFREENWSQLRAIVEEGYASMLLQPDVDIPTAFTRMLSQYKQAGGVELEEEINRLQLDKSMPGYTYMNR